MKCGNELNATFERCSCGYSRLDNSDYRYAQCNNRLNSQFERCICGHSRNDDIENCCVKCENKINNSASCCSNCKIVRAGYKDSGKYNPIYQLTLNDSIIFKGYKHLCIEFMVNELICDKSSAKKWLKGERIVFNPIKPSKKYPNKLKYTGLVAELIQIF